MIKYGQKKAPTQVKKGEKNSVNVRMISGDHLETCIFVAREAGIISKDEGESNKAVMVGDRFREKIGWYMLNGERKENYYINPDTNEVHFKKIDVF